jgi:hypothetical protein
VFLPQQIFACRRSPLVDLASPVSKKRHTSWPFLFLQFPARDYHGFANPCGLSGGFGPGRVRVGVFEPVLNPHPQDGLAGNTTGFRSEILLTLCPLPLREIHLCILSSSITVISTIPSHQIQHGQLCQWELVSPPTSSAHAITTKQPHLQGSHHVYHQ